VEETSKNFVAVDSYGHAARPSRAQPPKVGAEQVSATRPRVRVKIMGLIIELKTQYEPTEISLRFYILALP
jgi:hypothetical protein